MVVTNVLSFFLLYHPIDYYYIHYENNDKKKTKILYKILIETTSIKQRKGLLSRFTYLK
jgi:hypothetical protein